MILLFSKTLFVGWETYNENPGLKLFWELIATKS